MTVLVTTVTIASMKPAANSWKRLPDSVRKPLILIIGLTLVIMSGLIGWLPGPGGIPMFLAGVAILATEFAWAEQLRDLILSHLKTLSQWYQRHRELGNVLLAIGTTIGILTTTWLSNHKI